MDAKLKILYEEMDLKQIRKIVYFISATLIQVKDLTLDVVMITNKSFKFLIFIYLRYFNIPIFLTTLYKICLWLLDLFVHL